MMGCTLSNLLGIRYTTREQFLKFLHNSTQFVEVNQRAIKKVPSLRGRSIINLFLEPSTRTRVSFELAGKRLSADTINISGSESSTKKGETLLDTVKTIAAMSPDAVVIRSGASGAPEFLAAKTHNISIINAGDGLNEHPTQALLDCLSIRERLGKLEGLKVAIVGDVYHSRVARSNVLAHRLLGNEVRLVGPETLVPPRLISADLLKPLSAETPGKLSVYNSLKDGLSGVDVVMVLRMQLERQGNFFVPSLEEYSKEYGISENVISRYCPDAVVLHPGPINRGVEISSELAYGPRSLIARQVELGVAVRMAVLFTLLAGTHEG
jgi:aspartate carbamoyltransferase catalytic subunit